MKYFHNKNFISPSFLHFPPLNWLEIRDQEEEGGQKWGEPGEKGHQKPEFEVVGRSVILWTSYQLFIMLKITSFNMVIGILGR